jgi:hypothetical protein
MAGEDAVSTGTAAARKPRKVDDDGDELDNVPLAVSRGTKASNASSSKVKKEEDENSDNKPISLSRAKKVCFHLLRILVTRKRAGQWQGLGIAPSTTLPIGMGYRGG